MSEKSLQTWLIVSTSFVTLIFADIEHFSSVLIVECWGGSLSNRDISMLRSCDTAQFESIWILQTSSLACNGDQPSVLLLHLLCFRGKGASWRCSVARVLPVSLMPGPNEACIMPQLAEAWSRQRTLTLERKYSVLLEARLDFYLPLSRHLPPPTPWHLFLCM